MMNKSATVSRTQDSKPATYVKNLSVVRIGTCLIGSCLASFVAGRVFCVLILQTGHGIRITNTAIQVRKLLSLPVPLSESIIAVDNDRQCLLAQDGVCYNSNNMRSESTINNKAREYQKNNYCQHLSVDMENVRTKLLSSVEQLGHTLTRLSEQGSLNLLSHRCHELNPDRVDCVGILSSGRVSFQAWPKDGVLLLDIFACESKTVLSDMIQLVQKSFGFSENNEQPRMIWSYNQRALRKDSSNTDIRRYERSDERRMLSTLEFEKEHILSLQTKVQRIDIYDVIEPRFRTLEQYTKSQSHDGSYESLHPELYKKDRLVYLDGILSSKTYGEAAYYEGMVHPVMFTHQNPKKVAILGGGTGAILREVLKHKTVEKVVLIEHDELLMNVSKIYLPEHSNCSGLVGSTPSCFHDPRTEIYVGDASEWFISRFGEKVAHGKNDEFDVVIIDSIGPTAGFDISTYLYTNNDFAQSLSRSLGEKGILVSQAGEINSKNNAPSIYTGDLSDLSVARLVEEGFHSITHYVQSHGGLTAPRKFLVAMKDRASRVYWSSSEAEINVAARKRTISLKTGDSPYRFFDAATMKSFEFPSRTLEETWCTDNPKQCENQHGFDPDRLNYPGSSFVVGNSTIAKGGRGVFAKEFILNRSFLDLHDCVNAMYIPPETLSLMTSAEATYDFEYYSCFPEGYVDGYGWYDAYLGKPAAAVDPGIFTFLNHGCNGTNNVGDRAVVNISDFTPGMGPPAALIASPFHPFQDRHFFASACDELVAITDIQPGEEILDNYLAFGGADWWEDNVQEIQKLCSGGIGLVTEYEHYKEEK